jgi:AcrR family transcriptional regulator
MPPKRRASPRAAPSPRSSPRGRGRRLEAAVAGTPPTATQRRLLDAALGLFAERGYDGVSTAEIAARAGVAEKTLFANFGSKERLYQATLGPATVLAAVVPEAFRTLQPVLDAAPEDPRDLLRALIANRVRFARAHPRELRLVAQNLLFRPESAREIMEVFGERVLPLVKPILGRAVARGDLRTDVPLPSLVRIVASVGLGYAVARVLLRPDLDWDDDAEIDAMVGVLCEGILGGGAATQRATGRRRREYPRPTGRRRAT